MKTLRWILAPFSGLYAAGLGVRKLLYKLKVLRKFHFEPFILSVGNLAAGGTGKTPHVEYLVELLRDDYKVAVLSRGYGRKSKGFKLVKENSTATAVGDEPLQIKSKFPNIPVAVGERRALAIPEIMAAFPETEVIILDDAFQHLAVARDLDILLTQYRKPFFEDALLPAGYLRESRRASSRADVIIFTKTPKSATAQEKVSMVARLHKKKDQEVYFSTLAYAPLQPLLEKTPPVELTQLKEVLLLTAIADDAQILQYLDNFGVAVHPVNFRDHYFFRKADLEAVKQRFLNLPAKEKAIITTAKDAARLLLHQEWLVQQNLPVYVLPVTVIVENEPELKKLIISKVKEKQHNNESSREA